MGAGLNVSVQSLGFKVYVLGSGKGQESGDLKLPRSRLSTTKSNFLNVEVAKAHASPASRRLQPQQPSNSEPAHLALSPNLKLRQKESAMRKAEQDKKDANFSQQLVFVHAGRYRS